VVAHTVLHVKVQFTTTLVLTDVAPINRGRTIGGIGNGNDSALVPWFVSQTINDVLNLACHAVTIIALNAATFWQLPHVTLVVTILPTHVLLGIIVQRTRGEEWRFHQRRNRGNILNDAHEIVHDKFASLGSVQG
jgi:hypothetical protein